VEDSRAGAALERVPDARARGGLEAVVGGLVDERLAARRDSNPATAVTMERR